MKMTQACINGRCNYCDGGNCTHDCHSDNLMLDLFTLPPVVREKDPVTSHDAAKQLVTRNTMLAELSAAFQMRDMTAEEVATRCGYTAADGAWKRVSDLLNVGLIEPTGETRPGSSGRQQRVYRWVGSRT